MQRKLLLLIPRTRVVYSGLLFVPRRFSVDKGKSSRNVLLATTSPAARYGFFGGHHVGRHFAQRGVRARCPPVGGGYMPKACESVESCLWLLTFEDMGVAIPV